MTAAVESLHRQFPGEYETSVHTTCQEIWENNPHIVPASDEGQAVAMHYPGIHESHMIRTGHFMTCFTDYLAGQINRPLKLQVNRPSLYLTDAEKNNKIIDGKYIVVNSGVKQDYTCKGWGHANYQEVCDRLSGEFKIVQIGERHHLHRPLKGAIDLIGKTSPRELFSLVYNAAAGIGGVTFLQHIFAAFDKPYVCLLGGREPISFIWYPTQAFLAMQGRLKCCSPNACWKSRVVALPDGEHHNKSLCALPVLNKDGEFVPQCMDMIRPADVIQQIYHFRTGGLL
ncbi:glycosyltransferase family 9 protein [Fimbriiglobus ruber]|uniref:Uncharacterized protein n=1 Tax=Fimbriiglobus ruber TaxID=1908690 RepID=A0A225D8G7_9BACT|nr:glycosyltransferase family 9 protein [Fimbriiglobus ruber]OWK37890.1 hypothetical protein FRUB_07010 [Fimbriiglobus ruber]